ncbi:MAG: adenosylmethionine--8-amino-7-oxononanoate transaminase, partial [Mariprofundaceae bacterium]
WYPYTPMTNNGPLRPALNIEKAEGSYLIDRLGKRYIDGNGSWWVSNLGHQHPRLIHALKRQAEMMCHVSLAGISHEPAEALADAMVRVTPEDLNHVFFSDDGSTAIEVAARMALQYHQQTGNPQKNRFIVLNHAFHGETVACASFSDMPEFHQSLASLVFECERIPSPADGVETSLQALNETLEHRAGEIAALILEPLVQGAGGMKMYPPLYLNKVRELLDKYNVILIDDEVFTGYGRTGSMWASDQAGICPDILCTGKGFTGGLLPMAATIASEKVFQAFVHQPTGPDRSLRYGHSFCGNPLACAVALEVLQVYEDEQVLAGIPEREALLQQGLDSIAAIAGVSRPRRTGLIGAIDMEPDNQLGYEDPVGWRIYDAALKAGVYLRPLGNVIYFVPALNIPLKALNDLMEVARETISESVVKA